MNEEFKELTIECSRLIEMTTLQLIFNRFHDKEVTISNLINLLISIHFSSMFTCLEIITAENEIIHKEILKFIEDIKIFVSKHGNIDKFTVSNGKH
jgi:hypothetical protein